MRRLAIDLRPGDYAVFRLDPGSSVPAELFTAVEQSLVSITRTDQEISVICPSEFAPQEALAETGWRLLSVRGPLEFTLTGIISALSSELAAAGVALFSLSTFDTDHLLVKADDLQRAVSALSVAGHEVHGE
jgi:uncharacterized protein